MATGAPDSSTPWGAPSPTYWSSWQPQPTDWQPPTTYWQPPPAPTTYWQPPITQWQSPPPPSWSSSIVSSTPSISSTSRSRTSNVSSTTSRPAVASSVGTVFPKTTSLTSSSTGLAASHQPSSPKISIFNKGHYIAIGVCSFIVLLSCIALIVFFCCIRRRRLLRPAAHQRIHSVHYQKASRDNVESAYGIPDEIRRSQHTDDRSESFDERKTAVPLLRDSFLALPSPLSLRDSRPESLSFGSSNRSSRQLLPTSNIATRQIGNPISLLGTDFSSTESFLPSTPPSSPPKILPRKLISPKRGLSMGRPSPFLHRLPGAVDMSYGLKARHTVTPTLGEYDRPISNATKARLRKRLRSMPSSRRLTRKKSAPAESFHCAGEESDSDRTDTPSVYSQGSTPVRVKPLSRTGSVSSRTTTDDSSDRLSVLIETELLETDNGIKEEICEEV